MRKFFRRLFMTASVAIVAAAVGLVVLSGLRTNAANTVQRGSSSPQANQPAVKSQPAPALPSAPPPPTPPQSQPETTPSPAPQTVDFEVTAPAGFGINYSLASRQYRATVDGSGHWKGSIDKLPDGHFMVMLTVGPPKMTAVPYRATCEISYGGKIYVHNESDAQQSAPANVQCIKY